MVTKKLHTLFLCSAFITLSIISCGKYDDGPSISFRSKKQRIVNTWKNDNDNEEIYDFKADGSCELYWIPDLPFKYQGTWEFSDDKSQIIINVSGNPGFGTISFQEVLIITELRNNKLCVVESYLGYTYYDCFSPYE